MKNKLITIGMIIAAIMTIVASMIYFTSGIKIPALSEFSLALLMLGLVFNTREQFKNAKIDEMNYRIVVFIGTIAGVGNFIIGILNIIDLF